MTSHQPSASSQHHSSSSSNVVGVHYKVGKKLGEGSFGVLYEGTLASVFVVLLLNPPLHCPLSLYRNESSQQSISGDQV
jgi:hypothetical protein